MLIDLVTGFGLLAALGEGQRTIAHLLVLLAIPVVAGLVYLIRRMNRSDGSGEKKRIPEER
ncbi:MAG: hypothetical protein H0T61_02495 [Actinobacteria bacterium]|nr:hypothetical protein [Actinomycetota bacterium]